MKQIFKISLMMVIFVHSLSAQRSSAMKVSGDYYNKSLKVVFIDLKINYNLIFEYESDLIEDVRVSCSFRKMPLDFALSRVLEGTDLDFRIGAENKVAIFLKSDEPVVEISTVEPQKRNFDISGVVKDKNSGETLPFANIRINGTTTGTTTNVDGYFTLFDVPSDTTLLLVTYLGYQPLKFRLLPGMEMNKLQFDLEDFGVQLEEIIVLATKEKQMLSASSGVSRIGVSPAALSKLPSYGEKDIFRSLQLLPGVSGSNESSSGLYVRGGTPDQNLILFDGFTVYHVDHLFGFFSAFNTNAIKDVQLYKGGFESKYGGRLSSVVDMTGKDGNTERFNMGLGLSLLSINGYIESPFAEGKGSFLVAARRSFQSSFYNNIFEAYTDATQASSDAPENVQTRFARQEVQPNTYFYDLNAKVSYRPTDKDILSLSFYNGQDNLDNSRNVDQDAFRNRFGGGESDFTFTRENTDLTEWGNWGTSMKWSHRWDDRLYSNVNLSYSNYYSERDLRNTTTVTRDDTTTVNNQGSLEYNDLKDVSLKLDNEYKFSQNHQLDFGLHSTYNDIEYEFTENDTSTVLDRHNQGFTTALYLQDKYTFNQKLIVTAGFSTTHYSPTNKIYFEPRANINYLFSDNVKLKAAWGKYYQFANRIVREDIQQGSRDFWLLSDDVNVPISSSWHHILGISYENSDWLFDIEAYYKTLSGLSEYSTRFTRSGFGRDASLEYEEYFYSGDGVAKGIEFLAQRKVGKFTG